MDGVSVAAAALSIFKIIAQALFVTKSIQEQTADSVFKRSQRSLVELRHQLDSLSSSLEQIRLNVQSNDGLVKPSTVGDENLLGILTVGEEVLGSISRSLQRVEASPRKGRILPQTKKSMNYSKDVEMGTRRLQTCCELISITISTQLLNSVKPGNTKLDTPLQLIKDDLSSVNSSYNEPILDWITSFDYRSRHDELHHLRAPGTGAWLLDDTENFKSWSAGSGTDGQRRPSNLLWCRGIPGSGKSILTSTVVDHLLKQSKVDHSIGVAYFYFDYQIRVSPRDIIASLLKQLCYQKDKIPDSIMQLWELREAPEPHSSQETLKSDRVPEFGELLAAFSNLASKFRRTYVCLDALDECPEEHQHALQELLHRLRLARCSLLITSRPELKYEEYFKNDPQISIEATSEDIGYYVASILDQHPELRDMVDSGLQRKISTVLAEKSNGMFLFAALQMQQILEQTSAWEVKETLQSMPKTLHDVYTSMLDRIKEQSSNRSNLAMRILMWLSYSARSLTVQELQHAVVIDPDSTELNMEMVPPARLIEDVCMDLVTIDGEREIVLLNHSSLKHYLIQLRESLFPEGARHIARSCIAYLEYSEFGQGPSESEVAYKDRLKRYPFAVYAAQYFGVHLQDTGQDRQQTPVFEQSIDRYKLEGMLQVPSGQYVYKMLENHNRLKSVTQLMHVGSKTTVYQDYPRNSTGLHVAAYFGMIDLARHYLENKSHGQPSDSWKRTPLIVACEQGHTELADILMGYSMGLYDRDKEGRTPLHHASRNGHTSLVSLLLYKGYELDIRDRQDKTAVEYAAGGGHGDIVTKLLLAGAEEGNALSIAAAAGHLKIVELLLNAGRDSDEDQALIEAARSGFEDIVTLLLERGANLNFMDYRHMTALHYAAAEGRTAMTELLLMNGSSIQAQDRKGRTPLYLAAERGDEPTVKILTEYGAEIEARTLEGRTALTESASTGNAGIVDLLLRRGATVDSNTSSDSSSSEQVQENALQAAAGHGHVAVVRLLLEKYHDPDGKGPSEKTPLCYAAEAGHAAVIELLLEASKVDVNARDAHGRTPLSYAAENGNEAAVSLLLNSNKVDVNMVDDHGRSPLSYAAGRGNLECVKLLLSHGIIDTTLKDDEGFDALAYSTQSKNTDVRYILSHLPYRSDSQASRSSTPIYSSSPRLTYDLKIYRASTKA